MVDRPQAKASRTVRPAGHRRDRIAQGSATVASLTTAGIMAPLVDQLTVHPAYLVMIIGAGGSIFSWFNDSGFWIVKEVGGFSQEETLKIWTVLTTIFPFA